MACKITVIARVDQAGTWLAGLVNSLDAQDLPYGEFEVIFLVQDPGSGVGQRLAGLSMRRPNVRVAAVAAPERDAAALAREVTGEWVLDLGPDLPARKPVLFPQALSRLVGFGTSHDCQVVLGRAVARTGGVVDGLFLTDRPRLGLGVTSPATSSQVIVLRRDLAMTLGLGGKRDVERLLTSAENVGVLGGYPSLLITPPQQSPATGRVRVANSAVEWRRGRVVIAVTGSAEDASGGDVFFGIREIGSGLEYWLPSSTASCAGGMFSGATEIDVRTAALGSPLREGVWAVAVGIHGSAIGPLPPMSMVAGVIDGTLVAPATVDGRFALDIGATRAGVVPRLSPADVSIVESAKGTLMTVRLDGLAVDGGSRTSGSLLLDKFPLRAYLVAEHGHARIECFLSGLAGTSVLSAQFGSGKPEATGLDLQISPTGTMAVAQAHGRPARAVTRGTPPQPSPRGDHAALVVRLRRSVPARLEPAAKSLARNRVAARIYRTLKTGRAAPR